MARLPTRDELSQPGSLRSGRMISSADTSAIGRGLEAFGAGISALGEKQKQQQNVVDLSRAEAVKTQRFLDLQNQFEQDGDYSTFGQRAGEGTRKAVSEAGNLIRDKQMREKWLAQSEVDIVRTNDSIIDRGATLRRQAETNALDEALEANRRLYVDPLIPEDVKAKARNEIIGAIDVAGQAGLLTPDEVAARKRTFVEGADVNRAELADPDVILNSGGFEARLVKRESSGRPTIVNPWGYAGLYQFGAPRLADLGIYDPQGENLQGWGGRKTTAGKWTGEFNIPGHPEVKKLPDFLANPAAQKAAFEIHRQRMDKEIAERGLEGFIGQTVGGVNITRDGIHAMMHLGGAGGAAKALRSGGANNAADANGSSVLSYAKMGEGGSNDAMPDYMLRISPEERSRIVRIKQNELNQRNAEASAKARFVQEQTKDNYSLRIATGDYSLSRETILADPILDDGQKATLVNSYEAKFEEIQKTAANMQAFASGNLRVDPYDSEGRKAVDNLFDMAIKNAPDRIQPLAEEIVRQTGVVPDSVMSVLRQGLSSANSADVVNAAQAAARIAVLNPAALGRRDGGSEVQTAADDFSFFVNRMNLSPEEAAARMMAARNPEAKFTRKAMEGAAKEFVKAVEKEDISAIFSESMFLRSPEIGFSEGQRLGIQAEYVAIAEDQFYAANGDPEVAKNRAAEQMKRLYGVTEMTGRKVVMKHPPERYWPNFEIAGAAQSLSYPEQLKQAIREYVGARDSSGNPIDMSRPKIQNPDGTFSTEETITIESGGKWYNIPTIVDGKRVGEDAAVEFFNSGRNKAVGEFKTLSEAEAAARQRTQDIGNVRGGALPEIDMNSVQLVTTAATDAMVKRGEMPGYAVLYKDENGVTQTIPGKLWAPDISKLQQMQQTIDEAGTTDELDKARANQVQERQKAPYNVQKPDDFLSGEDPLFGPR